MAASDVRTQWASLMGNAAITALTTAIYNHQPRQDSENQIEKLLYGRSVHYITYTIDSQVTRELMGAVTREYRVIVGYHLEADNDGTARNTIVDNLETIESTLKSVLGSNWGGSVDYSILPRNPASITEQTIVGREVLRGQQIFIGTATTTT